MKAVPLALVFGVLVNACHRPASNDRTLGAELVGTWRWAAGTQGGGGATVLGADGKFVSKSTNRWASGSKEFSYEGRWDVKDGILTFSYLKTSEPKYMPVGKSDRMEIIRVDERELALLDFSENRTNILWRRN